MRLLAMLLFVAALAKVGLLQHLQQAGARDALVAAYGADAVRACEAIDPALKLAATRVEAIDLRIGDRVLAVGLWQVDHPGWYDRFRKVYLIIRGPDGTEACRFDVAQKNAKLLSKRTS